MKLLSKQLKKAHQTRSEVTINIICSHKSSSDTPGIDMVGRQSPYRVQSEPFFRIFSHIAHDLGLILDSPKSSLMHTSTADWQAREPQGCLSKVKSYKLNNLVLNFKNGIYDTEDWMPVLRTSEVRKGRSRRGFNPGQFISGMTWENTGDLTTTISTMPNSTSFPLGTVTAASTFTTEAVTFPASSSEGS